MSDHNGVTVKEAEAYADYLIASTAMDVSVAKEWWQLVQAQIF